MSWLCSCVSNKSSRSRTTYSNMSTKLRQPSNSRFGFSNNSRKQSSPASVPSELELKSVPNQSRSCDSALTGGLALDPSALLMKRCNDSLGGYIPREAAADNKPRPVSSIASLGQSKPKQCPSNDSNLVSDVKTTTKPKSTLRSLFSRSFTKDKVAASKGYRLSLGSNINTNNPKCSEGSLAGLRQNPRGSVDSTASSSSNHSTDSKSKLGFKRNSRAPARAQTSSPTPSSNHSDDNKTSKADAKSLQSKLATISSLPKSSSSALNKYSSTQSKSKPSKQSRLSLPASKLVTNGIEGHASKTKQYSAELALQSNNNVSSDECKERVNIDSHCYNTIKDASAPVATGDTDSETSFTSSNELSAQSTTNCPISTRTDRSMSAGSNNSDRKKPTVEINPITKEASPQVVYKEEEEGEQMGVDEKQTLTKSYTIDESLLSSIMSEVASLRSTVVELQHHLIGKQEYEEKMREELKIKNEIINNLKHELAQCVCHCQNGYTTVEDEQLMAAVR